MQTLHQKEAHLREHGFRFLRHVKHGQVWTDGTSHITVSRSTKHAHEFMKEVRLAVELRESKQTVVPNPTRSIGRLGDIPGLANLKVALSPSHTPQSETRRVIVLPTPAPKVPVALPEPQALVAIVVASDPAEAKKEPRGVRFDPETRYLLCLRVKELMGQGYKLAGIVQKLNEEGAKNPLGGPLAVKWVERTCASIRAGRMMEDPTEYAPKGGVGPKPEPTSIPLVTVRTTGSEPRGVVGHVPGPTPTGLPPFALAILREPTLTPTQRLDLFKSYAQNVPQSKLVTAILDENLPPAQAFKMLEAYLGL